MPTIPPRRPTRTRPERPSATPDYTPLYAVAGLTDMVAATVRDNLQQTQERAARRLAELQSRPARLEQQAKQNADELGRRLRSVPEQVKAAPEVTRGRVAELQRQLQGYRDEAVRTYVELAGRGRRAVDETVLSVRNLSTRAEETAEAVRADVAEAVDPALARVQEAVTVARKNATGHTSTPTVTSRSAARSAAARSAATARAAAEQVAAERLAAERSAVRRAAAKRAAATRAANRRAAEQQQGTARGDAEQATQE